MAERRRPRTSGAPESPTALAVAEPALSERASGQLPIAPASQPPRTPVGGWRSRIVDHGEVDPHLIDPNPRNPRVHGETQLNALGGILTELGWIQQCVVNRTTGHLIDGHARRDLAIARDEPTVPVVWVELSEDEELIALATFDPLGALAGIDVAAAASLVDLAKQHTVVQPVLTFLGTLADQYALPGETPPQEFPEYGSTLVTEHECPKCGYRWSGMASSSRHSVDEAFAPDDPDDDE
jgi:hypothetical protein